jgi:homoserine kinase
MALGLFNEFMLEESDLLSITCSGEGAGILPTNGANLAYRAISRVYQTIGKPVPALKLHLANLVPLNRGLGSSATAVVGGLVAANALNGSPLAIDDLLRLACELEGHPDNVSAALLGGLVVSVPLADRVDYVRLPVPANLKAVAFIPEFAMPTKAARSALPAQYSRQDAVFNIGRAALLVAGFWTGNYAVLDTATDDRLHQPYRQSMFPALPRFITGGKDAGARGAFLSGAGSTILAFSSDHHEDVSRAFEQVAQQENISGRSVVLDLSEQGASVIAS